MTDRRATDITDLLSAWRGGDEDALTELMLLTYRRLKEIAGHLLEGERNRLTLQTTALVHEAYLRLKPLRRMNWRDRVHFYAMSSRIMRRVLVDQARRRSSTKRGGSGLLIPVREPDRPTQERALELLAVDRALKGLAEEDPQRARIVELRFFGGLNRDEIAEVLEISSATVSRRWRSARAWLLQELATDGAD